MRLWEPSPEGDANRLRYLTPLAVAATAWWLGRRLVRAARRYDFRDKTVLITGGSRGLGLLLARRFARAGARVAVCARDRDELARARQWLAAAGADVLVVACDVTDRVAVEQAVQKVQAVWGPVDVLINNAGLVQVGPQDQMTLDDYRTTMAVHFWGPLHTIQVVLPGMRRRGGGRIVNVSSIGGELAMPHLLPYSASKFALAGLSEGLRAELLADGIYLTTVVPGLMRTGSPGHAWFKGRHQAEFAWFSVAASAPLLTMNAERAADRILRACRDGRAHLVLGLPARLAVLVHGIAPSVTAEALGLVARLLPAADGDGSAATRGAHSRPPWLPDWATRLGDRAARRFNQV